MNFPLWHPVFFPLILPWWIGMVLIVLRLARTKQEWGLVELLSGDLWNSLRQFRSLRPKTYNKAVVDDFWSVFQEELGKSQMPFCIPTDVGWTDWRWSTTNGLRHLGEPGFGIPLSSIHERSPFQVLPVDKVFNLPNISLCRKNCPEHLNSYFSNLPFNRH